MQDDPASFVESLADQEYEIPVPDRQFKPWHLPRKQLVRRLHIDGYLGPLLKDGDGPVRYLGLPGEDLLDIHWMRKGVCRQYERDLLFVGFDTGNGKSDTRFSIEEAKIKQLSRVDERSRVLKTAFESLGDADSVAFQQVRDLGEFDLVNLDLCNGLAGEAPASSPTTLYNALAQLLGLQVRRRQPWILMVTTRVDSQCVDDDAANKLAEILESNAKMCCDFNMACKCLFNYSPAVAPDIAEDIKALAPIPRSQMRSIALSKWLISLAANKNMPASLVNAIVYTVYRPNCHPDLLSLAFRIECAEPTPAIDSFGMAQMVSGPSSTIDCKESLNALEIVSNASDADQELAADSTLRERMIGETTDLLKVAGYRERDYKAWLEERNLG